MVHAFAERWVRTVRAECLDWVLTWNGRHLEKVLAAYLAHYNTARPHRALGLQPPRPDRPPADLTQQRIKRRPILGGLISEYARAA